MDNTLFREQNEGAIRQYFRYLSHLDAGACAELLTEEVRQYMPFAPAGFPQILEGKHSLLADYLKAAAGHRWMRFPVHALHATETPGIFLVEYSIIARRQCGNLYINKSVAKFTFRENLISEIVLYYNPLVLLGSLNACNELPIPFHLN